MVSLAITLLSLAITLLSPLQIQGHLTAEMLCQRLEVCPLKEVGPTDRLSLFHISII